MLTYFFIKKYIISGTEETVIVFFCYEHNHTIYICGHERELDPNVIIV